MTDNRQPTPRPPVNVNRNAQRAQTPIRGRVDRPWLDSLRTPGSVGDTYGDPVNRISDLVGHVLFCDTVESGSSSTKGRFTRWTYREVDPDSGEVLTEPDVFIAFAQPIVRMADRLAGGTLNGHLILNPPFVARVDREGDVVLFVDP